MTNDDPSGTAADEQHWQNIVTTRRQLAAALGDLKDAERTARLHLEALDEELGDVEFERYGARANTIMSFLDDIRRSVIAATALVDQARNTED